MFDLIIRGGAVYDGTGRPALVDCMFTQLLCRK